LFRPWGQCIHVFFTVLIVQNQSAISRIMERSNHPCHISERRTLEPSFTEASGRFTFKIKDHKILSSKQYLPQMVVTVVSDFDNVEFFLINAFQYLEYISFHCENLFGFFSYLRRKFLHVFT